MSLYAGDTILLAESESDLHNSLKVFENYCSLWKLKVNVEKTKILIFTKHKRDYDYEFNLYGTNIEIVSSYSYLGILFNYNGNFTIARKKLSEQAQKALYALYRKLRNISIPIDLQLKLFDSLIEPILLYSCEIWGFENLAILEKIHLQFLKRILSVRSSTPSFMVYGETGRYPLEIKIKLRILNFWVKLLQYEDKLCSNMYQLLYSMHQSRAINSKWITYVKSLLDDTGLSYVWNNQCILHTNDIKFTVKQILSDQFIQKWHSYIEQASRGEFYSMFKTEFCLENYLLRLRTDKRVYICKIRCSNLKFPIETGRWNNIPKHERFCNLCNLKEIGNEFHYICTCQKVEIVQLRLKYIPSYFVRNPSENKLSGLLSFCNVKVLNNLAIFLKKVSNYL